MKSTPNLFPYLTKAELWLSGHWDAGGVAVLRDGEYEKEFKLPQALFVTAALLIMAAQLDASRNPSWAASGFVSAHDLRTQLKHFARGGLDPDLEYVVKYIFRLREVFSSFPPKAVWARRFLEHQNLGYRLSTPPENLHLFVQE